MRNNIFFFKRRRQRNKNETEIKGKNIRKKISRLKQLINKILLKSKKKNEHVEARNSKFASIQKI